nr:hypothetical protein [Hassalia byssoidea]
MGSGEWEVGGRLGGQFLSITHYPLPITHSPLPITHAQCPIPIKP